jgi:hypothetical protein
MWVSVAKRGGWSWSKFGVREWVLALKSPHTMVTCYGCSSSMTDSSYSTAWASVMPRRRREDVGGRYTFVMFTRWLVGSTSLVYNPYSLPVVNSSRRDCL